MDHRFFLYTVYPLVEGGQPVGDDAELQTWLGAGGFTQGYDSATMNVLMAVLTDSALHTALFATTGGDTGTNEGALTVRRAAARADLDCGQAALAIDCAEECGFRGDWPCRSPGRPR